MTDKNNSIYAPYFEKNDEPFFMKISDYFQYTGCNHQ